MIWKESRFNKEDPIEWTINNISYFNVRGEPKFFSMIRIEKNNAYLNKWDISKPLFVVSIYDKNDEFIDNVIACKTLKSAKSYVTRYIINCFVNYNNRITKKEENKKCTPFII